MASKALEGYVLEVICMAHSEQVNIQTQLLLVARSNPML